MKFGIVVLAVCTALLGTLLASCGDDDAPVAREAATASPVPTATTTVAVAAPSPLATPAARSPSPAPQLTSEQRALVAVYRRYIDARNRGDLDSALATFAEDARFRNSAGGPCMPADCIGHAAIRAELERPAPSGGCLTVVGVAEAGGVVTAHVEVRNDEIRSYGVEYIGRIHTARVVGDRIATFSDQGNQADDNTIRFVQRFSGREPRGTPLPAPTTPCG